MSDESLGLRVLQRINVGMFIAMLLFFYFMIYLTHVEKSGVIYTPVKHFENYNHCGGE